MTRMANNKATMLINEDLEATAILEWNEKINSKERNGMPNFRFLKLNLKDIQYKPFCLLTIIQYK